MKFYSEILNKVFDSATECNEAEEKYRKEQEEVKAKESLVSKERKQLAKKIEECEAAIEDAYSAYELAKEEAKKILEESNQKMKDILTPAYQKIKDTQAEKLQAIQEFNKKFGAYTTSYTGEKARQEFQRATNYFNSIFDKLFW